MERERGVEAVLVNSETQQYIIIAVGSPVAVNLHPLGSRPDNEGYAVYLVK